MSKIAVAFAKAKERTGNTMTPFTPTSPAELASVQNPQLRQAAKTRLFWIVLLTFASLGTAFVIWDRLRPAETSVRHTPQPAAAVASSPAPAVLPTVADSTQLGQPVAPRPETQKAINSLIITAVLPGEIPRLMHKGRIIPVGQPITDDLVFTGIRDGLLVFTDARGATYVRRY